jgi:hypothetical protein
MTIRGILHLPAATPLELKTEQQMLTEIPDANATSNIASRAMNALSESMSLPTAHVRPFSFGPRVGGGQ